MSPPTTYQASIRLLTTVLIAATVANAAAVPHQVLDARAPAPRKEELPTTSDIAAALEIVAGEGPGNVFDDIEEGFRSRNGLQVIKDFFGRLFGWDDFDSPSGTVTVTVSVTPTLAATSEDVVAPTDLPATTTEDVVVVPEITAEPTEPMMSILPVGDMTTAINMTLPDPEFSNMPLPEETTVDESTPTALIITDSFTAIIPTETVISDEFVGTITLSEDVTSIILFTSTLVGTEVSVGTGLPMVDTAAPIWANTTFAVPAPVETEVPAIITDLPQPTIEIPVVLVNETGPIATDAVSLPIDLPWLNATAALPTETSIDIDVAIFTEIPVESATVVEVPAVTELPIESEAVDVPAASTSTLTTTTTLDAEDLATEIPTVDEELPTIVPVDVPELPIETPVINVTLPLVVPVVDPVPETNDTLPIIVPTPDIDDTLEFPGQF